MPEEEKTNPKILEKLQVTIKPFFYNPGAQQLEMQVSVYFDGKILSCNDVLAVDHFKSLFDHVWERAKYVLDDELKGVSDGSE